MGNRVDDFLSKLAAQAPKAKENNFEQKNRSLEKIYLNFPGNFGRYQVFPLDSVVTDFPFVTLFGTREINIPRKNMAADGTENTYNAWIKLLPKSAYVMKDMTGRLVSSLTAADDELLSQAHMIFDELYRELDAKNNRDELTTNLVRLKNYTIFHAFCLNKWDPNENRNPSRQNFTALFVATAKMFTSVVEDNIQEKSLMKGGDNSWISEVYNRDATGRSGFLMFSVGKKKDNSGGFAITATHEVGNENFKSIQISEEDMELAADPLQSFLSWQANRDNDTPVGQKRLFNAALIKESIEYMSEILASIRLAKSQGSVDFKETVTRVNNEVLAKQVPTDKSGFRQTNDPVLSAMSGGGNSAPQVDLSKNDAPFQTPPVYHSDPVTASPVNPGNGGGSPFGGGQQPQWGGFGQGNQQAPFQKPNFGGNNGGDDLPF